MASTYRNPKPHNDWRAVLLAAERSAAVMCAEVDEQEQMLDAIDRMANQLSSVQQIQSRIDERVRVNNERAAAFRKTIEDTLTELSVTDADLQKCCGSMQKLHQQLHAFLGT